MGSISPTELQNEDATLELPSTTANLTSPGESKVRKRSRIKTKTKSSIERELS